MASYGGPSVGAGGARVPVAPQDATGGWAPSLWMSSCGVGLCLVYVKECKRLRRRGDHADAVVEGVRDVEGAGLVHGHAERVLQAARVRGPAVAAELRGPVPGDGRDDERRVGKECRSRWSPYH